MAILFYQGDGLSKKIWVREEWKPKPDREAIDFFLLKNENLTRSWLLNWRGCFGQEIKWDA
jgi:hypothetical protein